MDVLVNQLEVLARDVRGSGFQFSLDGDRLTIKAGRDIHSFQVIRLYRPSVEQIEQTATDSTLLVLSAPSRRAIEAAREHNHLQLPNGSIRLIAPDLAIIHEANSEPTKQTVQVRLLGKTGVVVEQLLLAGKRAWSIQDLAQAAHVSPALAHRVLARLEAETLVEASGLGKAKLRTVTNPRMLAEAWSEDEPKQVPFFRGYLYGATAEMIADRVVNICPNAAVGGTLAANQYSPVLTRAPLPTQVWIPEFYPLEFLLKAGLQEVQEGANVELLRAKHDPWAIFRDNSATPRVSKWRAWIEISAAEGRTKELADTLLSELEGSPEWN